MDIVDTLLSIGDARVQGLAHQRRIGACNHENRPRITLQRGMDGAHDHGHAAHPFHLFGTTHACSAAGSQHHGRHRTPTLDNRVAG